MSFPLATVIRYHKPRKHGLTRLTKIIFRLGHYSTPINYARIPSVVKLCFTAFWFNYISPSSPEWHQVHFHRKYFPGTVLDINSYVFCNHILYYPHLFHGNIIKTFQNFYRFLNMSYPRTNTQKARSEFVLNFSVALSNLFVTYRSFWKDSIITFRRYIVH